MDLGFVLLREFGWLFRVFSRLDRVVLAIVDDPKTAFNELDCAALESTDILDIFSWIDLER